MLPLDGWFSKWMTSLLLLLPFLPCLLFLLFLFFLLFLLQKRSFIRFVQSFHI